VPDLCPVGRGQPPDDRGQRGGAGAALRLGQRRVLRDKFPERAASSPLVQETASRGDDLQGVRLALVARRAPGRDAVTAQDHADQVRVVALDGGDVQAELEARPPPRHPRDPAAEAFPGQPLAVGGGRERDPGIRVQVVHVGGVEQPVHGGVDRRGRSALAVQAVVKRRDHLVLALDARVDAGQRAEPVQAEHGEPVGGEGAQVAAGPLHPQQVRLLPGHRVGGPALGRGVAAGVVGVARVGPEPVAAPDQRVRLGR